MGSQVNYGAMILMTIETKQQNALNSFILDHPDFITLTIRSFNGTKAVNLVNMHFCLNMKSYTRVQWTIRWGETDLY